MATVQDYFNMAVSLTVGNKSGTDNSVFLPDDFRKLSNLKVKRYNFRTFTATANTAGAKVQSDYSDDSLCLVFFSHPVLITHVNGVDITAKPLHVSLFCLGRNLAGSAKLTTGTAGTNSIITYSNTLASPGFTAVAGGASDMRDVDVLAINVEFES